MPEMPEIEAHAERLAHEYVGRIFSKLHPFNFTALKTAVPPPDEADGKPLRAVRRRGKYLLLEFEPITLVIHLLQGGRLAPDTKMSKKPRGGQARLVFDGDAPPLLLTEQGTERRAGIWCVETGSVEECPPVDKLGPEAVGIDPAVLADLFAANSMRVHGFLRDQRMIAGIGRRLANEVCWQARVSPFATTKKLGPEGARLIAASIDACAQDGLEYERTRADMSSSKDRPRNAHGRTDEPCSRSDEHGDDTIRAVEYSGYTVNYCPSCQTGGKILADNTTSKFLK